MEVHFTPEQEAQIALMATKAGKDAERMVKDLVLRLLENETHFARPVPELPQWDLGVTGPLSRGELYDDVH